MSYTFGSNEKPVLMTNKKNGGRIGKGSRLRPGYFSQQYKDNYDKIFGKKVSKADKAEGGVRGVLRTILHSP